MNNSLGNENNDYKKPNMSKLISTILSAGVIGSSLIFPNAAFADEIGRETEAPTLYTGETVEVLPASQFYVWWLQNNEVYLH